MTGINEINRLVKRELEKANKAYSLFRNAHEAYAVILEEVQETEEMIEQVRVYLDQIWANVRTDEDITEEVTIMEKCAIEVAREAIQVAAMCRKTIESEV